MAHETMFFQGNNFCAFKFFASCGKHENNSFGRESLNLRVDCACVVQCYFQLGGCMHENTSAVRKMRAVCQGSHLPMLPVAAVLVGFLALASCSTDRVFLRQTLTIPKTEAQKGYIVFLALWAGGDEPLR